MGTTGWHLNPSPRAWPEQGDWGAHAHVPRGCMGTTQPVAGIPCAAVGELLQSSRHARQGHISKGRGAEHNCFVPREQAAVSQMPHSCPLPQLPWEGPGVL